MKNRHLKKLERPSWNCMWIEDEGSVSMYHPLIILLWSLWDVLRIWRQRYIRI
jgi:hypothetical protein